MVDRGRVRAGLGPGWPTNVTLKVHVVLLAAAFIAFRLLPRRRRPQVVPLVLVDFFPGHDITPPCGSDDNATPALSARREQTSTGENRC